MLQYTAQIREGTGSLLKVRGSRGELMAVRCRMRNGIKFSTRRIFIPLTEAT